MIKFKHFNKVSGEPIQIIPGQDRIGYSLSSFIDFYDMAEIINEHKEYAGSIISFYDFSDGMVYTPFIKQTNIIYGEPVFLNGHYWFLQGDYTKGILNLFQYLPNNEPKLIIQLPLKEVDCYNLRIIGENVHLISVNDNLTCYYPQSFSIPVNSHESILMIDDNQVYFSSWVEEGWDEANNCQTNDYCYYEKVIVKDYNGNVISEKKAALCKHPNGTWWLS